MNITEWRNLVLALETLDVETCVSAAAKLHAESSAEDVPRLLQLLGHESFLIREAAAWPLAELQGPRLLLPLLSAYQRGFDEGHDNDGFTAALLEIPELFPLETPAALAAIIGETEEPVRGHAEWLLQFCSGVTPGTHRVT